MADISKDNEWYAELTLSGTAERVKLEGTIQQIVMGATIALRQANLRKDSNGNKSWSLSAQNTPFASKAKIPDWMTPEMYDEWTRESNKTTAEEEEQIYANRPEWEKDPEWWEFRRLQATQSNYDAAIPSQIRDLQDSLRLKYGGQHYDMISFDDTIIDKRSHS